MNEHCGWIALAGLALVTTGSAEAGSRRALLVAIDKYHPPTQSTRTGSGQHVPDLAKGGRGSWTDLDGAVNDALALRELLAARFGFERTDILVLTDAEATREGILAAYRQHLIDQVQAGDEALFFYAGHGSRVRNSLTDEPDGMDESLVPADSYRGAADLRDKELNRLFVSTIDKGASLTVISDSCHSGSIARGLPGPVKVRSLPPDERDVRTPPEASAKAEERGALVLSAAQDHQFAGETSDPDGNAHGAFSLALLTALQAAPRGEAARDVFQRARALMQASGAAQEPVMAGLPQRRRQPLFGAGGLGPTATRVAVVRRLSADRVLLQGGVAVGLQPGCELKAPDGSPPLRFKVTRTLGLTAAEAQVIGGQADAVVAGSLLEVDRWTWPDAPLRVWWATPLPTRAQVAEAIQGLRAMREVLGAGWVGDPTSESPTHVVSWSGSQWELRGPAGVTPLGAELSISEVHRRLHKPPGSPPRLFVQLPPHQELVAELEQGRGEAFSLAKQPADAQYLLAGRIGAGERAEYAWITPNGTQADAGVAAMPIRSDWTTEAAELEGQAFRLGRLRAWLQLQPPPEPSIRFPYRLALRSAETDAPRTEGVLRQGDAYGLVLRASQEDLDRGVERRYVYVFALDAYGTGTLLFPRAASGNVENRVPFESSTTEGFPPEIPLGPARLFTIGPPFGVDTYVLLSTVTPIPDPSVLELRGARTRGPLSTSPNPLERLLQAVQEGTRGTPVAMPSDWSIDRLTLRSVPVEE